MLKKIACFVLAAALLLTACGVFAEEGASPVPEKNTLSESEKASVCRCLELFFAYWSANSQDDMLKLCSSDWVNMQEKPRVSLFALLGNRTPKQMTVEDLSGTSGDPEVTATVTAMIDRNNGKEPALYRLAFRMVLEDGIWYVDPQGMASVEPVGLDSVSEEYVIRGGVLEKYYSAAEEVTVPDGVLALGESAFQGSQAAKIILPDTLQEIRSWCFYNCYNLTEVTLPASLINLEVSSDGSESVNAQVFYGNPKLEAIQVEDGNERYASVDGVLFTADGKKLLYYPDGKNAGGHYAIPEGTAEIGYTAFGKPTLTSVTFPASLASLHDGGGSFAMIPTLRDVYVSSENDTFCSLDGVLYRRDGALALWPNGRTATVLTPEDFPRWMNGVGEFAFQGDRNLHIVELPEGTRFLRWMCFCDAAKLESVTVPASVEDISGYVFADCRNLKKVIVLSMNARFPSDNNILEDSSSAVLYGYENSTAQAYAKKMGLRFESLGEAPASEQ